MPWQQLAMVFGAYEFWRSSQGNVAYNLKWEWMKGISFVSP